MSGPGCMVSIVNTSQGLPDTSDAEQPLALLSEEPFILILTMSTATRFRRPIPWRMLGKLCLFYELASMLAERRPSVKAHREGPLIDIAQRRQCCARTKIRGNRSNTFPSGCV